MWQGMADMNRVTKACGGAYVLRTQQRVDAVIVAGGTPSCQGQHRLATTAEINFCFA